MTLAAISDPASVIASMAEYRALGRDAFLAKYGYGGSRFYVVAADGRRYDAKAIVGAAHGFQFPGDGPLTNDQFSGGVEGANAVLERLGFEVADLRLWSIDDERRWRDEAWAALEAGGDLTSDFVRELGAYGGAQGIWVDKERTSVMEPAGIAVGVLHTGRHYADDLDESGIVYHYPHTRRSPGRDAGEVQAVKNAAAHKLPIFVVSEAGPSGRFRQVRLGWVLDHDDEAEVFLVEFATAPPQPVPSIPDVEATPFVATSSRRRKKADVERLERDPKFKFEVLRRFGGRCALSNIGVPAMLDAAHVIPVEDGGPDDERNGLLLSAGLHRAYDAGLWAIEPSSLSVVTRPQGPSAQEMGISTTTLTSLSHPPHEDAIRWRYQRFCLRHGLDSMAKDS